MALRLLHTDVECNQRAIKAMDLSPNSCIVSCLPYSENLSVLCMSTGGTVLLTKPDLMAHHKGSKGAILMRLEGSDTVAGVINHPDAFLMLRGDGAVLCLATNEMAMLGRGAKGRQGMRLKSGQSIFGILPLTLRARKA